MPNPEIKITVKWDNVAATRSIREFTAEQAKAQRQIATDSKIGATALLREAQAQETLSRAAVATAKSAANLSQANQLGTQAANASIAATEKQAKALERLATAQSRARVAGENRQHRDEGYYARQQIAEERDAQNAQERAARARSGSTLQFAQGAKNVGAAATMAISVPIVLVAAQAIQQAAGLEQSLNVLQQVSHATNDQMKAVAKTARDLGADMTLPATSSLDAANAMTELAQKGLSVKDVMAASLGTMRLAAATNIEAARAAEIEADALNAFGLAGAEATRIADMFAASQSASGVTVEDNAEAMKMAAASFRQAKIPIDALETSINMMAKAGVVGSDAGTSLKTAITFLAAPTDEAQKVMHKLGISVYDAHGKIKPYRDIIASVTAATSGLSDAQKNAALRTLFGTDAIRAATFVLAAGTDGYDKMHTSVTRQGAAAELAAAKNKGLKGAMDALGSAIQTVEEENAAPFLKTLTDMTLKAGSLLEKFNRLPEPVKEGGLALAGVAAVAGPLVFSLGSLVVLVKQFQSAIVLREAATGILALQGIGTASGEAATGLLAADTAATGLGARLALLAKGVAIPITLTILGAVAAGNWLKNHIEKDILDPTNKANDQEANQPASSNWTDKRAAINDDIRRLKLIEQNAKAHQAGRTFNSGLETSDVEELTAKYKLPLALPGQENKLIGAINPLIDSLAKQLPGINSEIKKSRAAERGGVTGETPNYVRAMMADVGKNVGLDCGQAITKYLQGTGHKQKVSELDTPANRVLPNAAGQYPEGTIFRPGRGRVTGQGPYRRGHYEIEHYTPRGPMTVESNYRAHNTVSVDRPFNTAREVRESTWGGAIHAFLPPGVPRVYPSGAAAAAATGGVPTPHGQPGGGDAPDESAKAAVLVEKAGLRADEAKRAFEDAKTAYERTNDIHYLVAATSIRRGMLAADINAAKAHLAEENAGKDPNKEKNNLEFQRKIDDLRAASKKDLQVINDKLNGSVADRLKAGFDVSLAMMKGKETQADRITAQLEALVEKTTDPHALNALQSAYTSQATTHAATVSTQLAQTLSTIPAGHTAERKAAQDTAANEQLRISMELHDKIAAVTERRAQMAQRLLDIQTQQIDADHAVLDAQLGTAKTEADRLPIRQQINALDRAKLTIDRASAISRINEQFDPLIASASSPGKAGLQSQKASAVAAANDRSAKAFAVLQTAFSGQEVQAANEQIQQRADRLRTEASLTDDLTVKMTKLAQAFDLIIGITPEPGDAALLRRQKAQEQHALGRDRTDLRAQTDLAGGILSGNPVAIGSALDKMRSLITDPQATRSEQQGSRGSYLSQLVDLVRDQNITGKDALARVVDPSVRKGQTPGEIAASVSAARQILDSMLGAEFTRIALIKNPAQRKAEMDALGSYVASDPTVRSAGVTQYGVSAVKTKLPEMLRKDGAMDQFFNEFAQGASQAGSGILHHLLHPHDGKGIMSSFWSDLEAAGEGSLSNLLQKELQHGAEKLFASGLDGLFSGGKGANPTATQAATTAASQAAAAAATQSATTAATKSAGGAAAGGAASSAAGGAFASMSTIAPYLAAVAVLSNPQVVQAITTYVSTAAKATAMVIESIGKEASMVIKAYGAAISEVVGAVGKGIQSIEQGLGSAAQGIGTGIGRAADGIGSGIGKILGGITGANAMRVAVMNVAHMDHAIVLQGGASGLAGGLLGGVLGAVLGGVRKLLHFGTGGMVPGYGNADTVPAMLTPGEMVLTPSQSRRFLTQQVRPMLPGGGSGGVSVQVNNHNPVYNNNLDIERANEQLARKLQTAFTIG